MFIALCILAIIALFIAVYYFRSSRSGAIDAGSASRISGGAPGAPTVPGQTSHVSSNPGSHPDNRGQGGAAMSTGMQG